MNGRTQGPKPEGWGGDSLSDYLENFRNNQFATFANMREEYADLAALDGIFLKLLFGAKDPSPFIPMMFLLRAHSAWRSGCGAALSGQIFELHALLRLALEHTGYGFYIGGDQERWKRWMARGDSEEAKKAVRTEFTTAKVKNHLVAADPVIGGIYDTLYERMIEYGAHPNEVGFSTNSNIRREQGEIHIEAIYLQAHGVPLKLGIKTTAQVGICILRIAHLLYPLRFRDLGIEAELKSIMARGY